MSDHQAVTGIGKGAMTRFAVVLQDGSNAEVSVAFERDLNLAELADVREALSFSLRAVAG